MPQIVKVIEGDSVDSIGLKYGFAPDTLWNAPENGQLRALRKDPNVLFPGDSVFVPDLRAKEYPALTDKRYSFRRRRVPSKLRLQLLDDGKPRAGLAYQLQIGDTTFTGNTDSEGRIEHWVTASATTAVLTLPEGELYDLQIGYLDPIAEKSGVDARLASLGYLKTSEEVTEEERAKALRCFQYDAGLELTGVGDAATRAALMKQHGC